MNLLALDISSKAVGWTYILGKKRVKGGTIWRNKDDGLHQFACRVDCAFWRQDIPVSTARIVYEINDAPLKRYNRADVFLCNRAIGRVLQALGVEGEAYQADRKPKKKRRQELGLIYDVLGTEQEMDSLALAHRCVSEVK